MMLVLPPEIVAALEAIRVVECLGDRQTACERDGTPKPGYSSAACARRGVLIWSWRRGTTVTENDVVYQCTWCGDWHHGRDRSRGSEVLAA